MDMRIETRVRSKRFSRVIDEGRRVRGIEGEDGEERLPGSALVPRSGTAS